MKKGAANANTGPWLFLVTDQASLHPPPFCNWLRTISPLFLCLACLHYIRKSLTFRKPWGGGGGERHRARLPKRNLWLQGQKICFADEAGQSRGGIGGHHLYVCGQTVQHFFALALCQQPTPLSLSPSWELLPTFLL